MYESIIDVTALPLRSITWVHIMAEFVSPITSAVIAAAGESFSELLTVVSKCGQPSFRAYGTCDNLLGVIQ